MRLRIRRGQRPGRPWLRRLATFSLLTGWIGVLMLAWPLVAHGQTDALASYGATASGWAIKPFVENDEFQNIPATDEASPFVYVEIDSNPSADAIAAVVSQSTLVNAALGTQGANASGPKEVDNSVEARYPGQGSDASQLGVFSDGKTTQAGAGMQSAQAQEGSAQAEAAIGSYQFVPPTATPPAGVPTPPPLPTVTLPPLPTVTLPPVPGSSPTPTSGGGGGGGGGTPTPTPTSGNAPTPTPTPCPVPLPGGGCLAPSGHPAGTTAGTTAQPLAVSAPASTPTYKPAIHLPDLFEQNLTTALRALELANPQLLALSGGKLPTPDPTLPLAAADGSSIATTNASDSGVTATVQTHLANVELLQGLLTFTTLNSTLQAIAPANQTKGQGQITTTFTGASLAGIPITIDENGVQIACQQGSSACQKLSAQQIQSLSQQLNTALAAVGISISLTKPVTLSDVGKWNGSGGGLDVSGAFNPPNSPIPVPSGVPNPTNGIATTHVDFSLGEVTANLFVVPNPTFSSGGGSGGFGGFGGFGGGVTQVFGNPGTPGTNQHGSGLLGIGSLNPGDLLALLFIVQGFSTAAVASAASSAEESARAALPRIEEETQ